MKIQNAFPIIGKYFEHVHTIQEQLVTIHKKQDKALVENLNEVLAMYNRGIKLTFMDIRVIFPCLATIKTRLVLKKIITLF